MKCVFQRQMRHVIHLFFARYERPDRCDAESTKKQHQSADAEPLNAIDGL